MNPRLLLALGALLVVSTLAACGNETVDESTPPSGRTGEISLPPRPQDIPVDEFDPCSVFTNAQLRSLDVDNERFTPANERRGPVCQWSHADSEPFEGYGVATITFGEPGALIRAFEGHTSVISVHGFPAIVTDQVPVGLPRPNHCSVLVSVAEGQSLEVTYDYNGSELSPMIEQSCEKAIAAAEMAMQTLIDRAEGGR